MVNLQKTLKQWKIQSSSPMGRRKQANLLFIIHRNTLPNMIFLPFFGLQDHHVDDIGDDEIDVHVT
jgi:hypothetical protein